MLRILLTTASAVLICGSGPTLATPFTLEDMLRIEQFGQVSLSPHETTVAFERIGPTLGAGPYEYDALDLVLRSQILVAPSDGHTAPRPLLPEIEGRRHDRRQDEDVSSDPSCGRTARRHRNPG